MDDSNSPQPPVNNQSQSNPPTVSDQSAPPPTLPPTTPVAPAPAPVVSSQKKSRKIWLFVLIVLLIAAAIAGGVAYSKHTNKPAAAAKKDIPYLRYGTDETADLTQVYPTEAVDTDTTTQVNTQLFEGLVRYQEGTKIVPLLATSWSNPDDTTWVFNLQHGVKFHNGRTMTATDVKKSLDYAVAHQNDNSGATLLSLASTIKEVQAVNPYQVKITTDGPDPVLLNRLAYLYVFDTSAKTGDPDAGTGPYVVKPGSKPTANSLDLTAYNSYWGGHIYTRAVHIQVAGNDQLAADTNKGQFDIAGDFTSQQLTQIKHYRPITIQDLGITFLGLNTVKASSPLSSLAARQAASYALNIPAILKAGGLSGTQASQLIPPAIPGYDPSIHNIPYNPAKAKQLLATVPNAATQITLSYPKGDDGQVIEIAKELNAVGFNVKTDALPDLDTLVNVGLSGQTDMFYLGDSTSTLDGLALFNDIVIAADKDYSNPTVTKLADQAGTTLDPAARIALLQKISQQVANDVSDIPLFNDTRTVALTKPYHVQVDIPSIEAGVYFWQIYQ
ncbi:MAG TPA: ABC transporter substrate-binding protein [Candidatus Saccharimonadales bacterium]